MALCLPVSLNKIQLSVHVCGLVSKTRDISACFRLETGYCATSFQDYAANIAFLQNPVHAVSEFSVCVLLLNCPSFCCFRQAVWEASTICPHPLQVAYDFLTLKSGVRVACDVGYLCANFSFPRPLCSRLRLDVRDRRQTCTIA